MTVQDGVGGEFSHDLLGAFGDAGWHRPCVELFSGEEAGETGSAAGGRQKLGERVYGARALGCGCAHEAMVTGEDGRTPEVRSVRCVSVRALSVDRTTVHASRWVSSDWGRPNSAGTEP